MNLKFTGTLQNLQRRHIRLPDDSGPAEDLGQKVPDINNIWPFPPSPCKKIYPPDNNGLFIYNKRSIKTTFYP